MDLIEQPRTKLEAESELDYEIRLHYRHARLYGRVRKVLTFIAALGSASAFANAFAMSPMLTAIGGLVVALCGFADIVWDFGTKAAKHEVTRQAYCEVLTRVHRLSLEQLDAAMARIAKTDPGHIEALRWPVQNDVLRTRGYNDHLRTLTAGQKFMDWLA